MASQIEHNTGNTSSDDNFVDSMSAASPKSSKGKDKVLDKQERTNRLIGSPLKNLSQPDRPQLGCGRYRPHSVSHRLRDHLVVDMALRYLLSLNPSRGKASFGVAGMAGQSLRTLRDDLFQDSNDVYSD